MPLSEQSMLLTGVSRRGLIKAAAVCIRLHFQIANAGGQSTYVHMDALAKQTHSAIQSALSQAHLFRLMSSTPLPAQHVVNGRRIVH